MITAENITDEQICKLRDDIAAEGARGEYAYCFPSVDSLARAALGKSDWRHAARARCAEILNTRPTGGKP